MPLLRMRAKLLLLAPPPSWPPKVSTPVMLSVKPPPPWLSMTWLAVPVPAVIKPPTVCVSLAKSRTPLLLPTLLPKVTTVVAGRELNQPLPHCSVPAETKVPPV